MNIVERIWIGGIIALLLFLGFTNPDAVVNAVIFIVASYIIGTLLDGVSS